jgi:H(+)-translocating pyrophosphatase
MVGDCVGSSADVFESVAAEIIGAMILGSTLADEAKMGHTHATKFVFFPLVVHAMDIMVSSLGIAFVGLTRDAADNDPMKQLQKGYRVALGSSVVGFYVITNWLLEFPENPGSGFKFFLCGIVGIVCAYVIVLSTQYYTDYAYRPVQSIAEASTTGHGTNIIVGVSVGMKATFIPTIAVAIAVLAAYHLGASANIGEGRNSGLFGTAVATMGMLSNAVYILSMNNFGPIADNAGGITEMSMQPEAVREVTDRLDAAGNVTKAVTKGYSIGSASMACFLLFGAFMDEFSEYSGLPFTSVNIATPEVLVGGLIGSMIIFYFTGLAIAAVGRTAHEVVLEVRRQFKENPGIMTYEVKPDYERCVSLVTEAALREMRFPGLVAVLTPIIVGLIFRFIGEATNRPLLGAEVLASYLMFGTVTGILMALFLDTAGGAWDNAKKYIEMGNFGGKNSEAHKASITGDTVGDPFVSLHVLRSRVGYVPVASLPLTHPLRFSAIVERYSRSITPRRHQTAIDNDSCCWTTVHCQSRLNTKLYYNLRSHYTLHVHSFLSTTLPCMSQYPCSGCGLSAILIDRFAAASISEMVMSAIHGTAFFNPSGSVAKYIKMWLACCFIFSRSARSSSNTCIFISFTCSRYSTASKSRNFRSRNSLSSSPLHLGIGLPKLAAIL